MSDLELVHAVIVGRTNSGSIDWKDLAKLLSSSEEKTVEKYKKVLPTDITVEQFEAIEALPGIFGVVVPDTFRKLDEEELEDLVYEREVEDVIAKMLAKRKEDIRTTILNHFDVKNEGSDAPRDKDGHFLKSNSEVVGNKKFTWEVNDPDPIINQDKLEELLTEDEWMHVTVDTRVFDEERAMDYLKLHPELMDKIVQSVETPKPVGRFNIRDHHE